METSTISIRVLIADEGMVITDVATETLRSKKIYLGKGERKDRYEQIPEDTPLPEESESEEETPLV